MAARQSPEPSMCRHRPASELTQDISHLLASMFKNMYTSEVIGEDTVKNLIKSRRGDHSDHERFVEELQKVHLEFKNRLKEAEMIERHIIQARARATAEEERMLNRFKEDVPEQYQDIGLPPVKSTFRWCVDDELLKKHNLICPGDYITDPIPITRAPKESSEPGYLGEIISFQQHVSEHGMYKESEHVKKLLEMLPEVPCPSVTMDSSASDIPLQVLKPFCKKSGPSRKLVWKDDMSKTERDQDRAYLKRLDARHNFLRNPRYFLPNTLSGGKSLILPQRKVRRMISGKERTVVESSGAVPIFLSNPPVVLFSDYEVGRVYEMTIELQNMTSTSQNFRIIPPATAAFAIGLGKFPGEGGIVAPGMSCYYTVQFIPEHLANYEDYVLVETQSPYPLVVPLEARRPPPILTLPEVLDCGACLVGGVKFSEYLCRNEGTSSGKFCIMPKGTWPPPHFQAVATFGFVEQESFGIQPAVFELFPGQSVVIETVFFPSFPGTTSVTYIIVCDNCQIKEITVTGLGQLISLKLLSVTGGESSAAPGELVDIMSQHFIRFDSLNPCSVAEKTLVIRNMTHVDLPCFWQIMKPNLQSILFEGDEDLTKIKYNLETDSAFSITPAMSVLYPHTDHPFTLRYFPRKLKSYHSVLQIVLENIPELPSLQKQNGHHEHGEIQEEDVIALEIDIKGRTEPFQLLLEPYLVVIPGEHYISVNIRRSFRMHNNSKSSVRFTWGKISDCDILEVQPYSGKLGPNELQDFELILSGGKPGHSVHALPCKISHCAEPVILHVEADFKGPLLSVDVPSLSLGLVKLGEAVSCKFQIRNLSQLPGRWKMQESLASLAERNEEVSPFTIKPPSGELGPLDHCTVSVLFRPNVCQSLQTVLEMEVENGKGSHIPVSAEVQTPRVCLLSSSLHFDELFLGIAAKATAKLFNQMQLPAHFQWGEVTGSQSSSCRVSISPESGILAPNEEKDFCVELTANIRDELSDLSLCCRIGEMLEPLVLRISGTLKRLHVTYAIPFDGKDSDLEQPSEELLLDFGSEVPLKSVVKRQLVITSHSAVDAAFTVDVDYFSSGPPPPEEEQCSDVVDAALEKTRRVTRQIVKRKQSTFRAALLSHGKGLAFHVHPSAGTLKAFQKLTVEITAYNDMWGEYKDNLLCKVGDTDPKSIPMKIAVKGCPIFLQAMGPNHLLQTPIIRFGSHISGGDTVSRYIRLNNPTPFDIRMDWESYNQDKDDDKLVDLLVFYGAPFPIKDIDGNEVESTCEEKTPTDQSQNSSGSATPPSCGGRWSLHMIFEADNEGSSDGSEQPLPSPKIVSVVLRPHEGVPSDYPFCITPKQIVIPAGGAASIHISFTPLMLPEIIHKFECEGFALGFMSLDSKVVQEIPGKVRRADGHGVAPLRIDLQAFVKPALLTVEMDHDYGLEFYALASSLIPSDPLKGVLTNSATSLNLKLTNDTETTLSFKLLLTAPFSVSGVDPKTCLVTSHSDRENGGHHFVLSALQNMLVKVSFHTTLELLTYQHLPEDQMLSGVQMLQLDKGDKILEFKQDLIIEHSNKATQVVPMTAFLSVPVLELSSDSIDFGTCLVNQTRREAVFVTNKSGCRSYWAALLDEAERHNQLEVFSLSPNNGVLEAHYDGYAAKTQLVICFTAREDVHYETTVTVVGMLGERPCNLRIQGRGSYNEKYEERRKS